MTILRYSALELLRHPARSFLAVAGVAVACAMLLDMLMLGGGLDSSFRSLLTSAGYELRVSPGGTLPFDTDATFRDASRVRETLESNPAVEAVAPVLASNLLRGRSDEGRIFALGVDPGEQGIYRLVEGSDLADPRESSIAGIVDRIVIGEELRETGLQLGDTLTLRVPGSFAEAGSRVRRFTVSGVAEFLYASAGERPAAMSLSALGELASRPDEASLMMVRVEDMVDPDSVARALSNEFPELEIASVGQLVDRAARRLSYFRQLAAILGTVSLIVTTLLIGTIMAISINDRYGTIAALRAIGISRRSLVSAFAVESLLLCVVAATLGLGLGIGVAGQLEKILSDFPGLPAAIRFFVLEPGQVALAASGILLAGVLAALVPAWRAMNAPIATTLHREEP